MKYRKVLCFLCAPITAIACHAPDNSQVSKVEVPELASLSTDESAFLNRDDVRGYIVDVSKEHQLDANRIALLFAQIQPRHAVLEAISRPAEKVLTWAEYQPIFIGPKRIDAGRAFMQEHASTLARAEQEFGVPANVIAAIIGVETFYGRVTGQFGVLESVATLAFSYPPRATFFKSELTEFLVLSQAEGWDPLAVNGSYAGAMGWPQFIASSYRHYAIDFDGDGRRDLFNSPADIIGSVANYLNKHGWKAGEPVVEQLPVKANQFAAVNRLQRKSLKPSITPTQLKAIGFNVVGSDSVSVMNLQGKGGEEVWMGYKNFYVITRYNHSAMYALAVYQLGELLTNRAAK